MTRQQIRWILVGWAAAGLGVALAVMWWPGREQSHAPYRSGTRTYYIAAVTEDWNYAPQGQDPVTGQAIPLHEGRTTATKRRFREYTGADFATAKTADPALGILGPTIRGVPGDTVKVVFRNTTAAAANLQAPGLPGAGGAATAAVAPGGTATYTWKLTDAAGPAPGHGGSRAWPYASTAGAGDANDGLIGAVIITAPAHAKPDATPDDTDAEFVAWLKVFDEPALVASTGEPESARMHSIDGLIYSNQTGYVAYTGNRTRWHLLADPADADVTAADWSQPQPIRELDRRQLALGPAKLDVRTVDITMTEPGQRIFHAIHPDHRELGMQTIYYVHTKPSPVFLWIVHHAGWLVPAYRFLFPEK